MFVKSQAGASAPAISVHEKARKCGLLSSGGVDVHPLELVSELGRLGVRLVLQRAVEEEVDDWLGRARYERRPEGGAGEAQRLSAAAAPDR